MNGIKETRAEKEREKTKTKQESVTLATMVWICRGILHRLWGLENFKLRPCCVFSTEMLVQPRHLAEINANLLWKSIFLLGPHEHSQILSSKTISYKTVKNKQVNLQKCIIRNLRFWKYQ